MSIIVYWNGSCRMFRPVFIFMHVVASECKLPM
jgi:hypothetical protein